MTAVLETRPASNASESDGEMPTQVLGNAATIAAKLAGTPTRYVLPICHDFPEGCKHAAGYHTTTKADLNVSHRFFGLTRRPDGSAHLTSTGSAPKRGKVPVRVCESVAACAAVGLNYWSEAPGPGGVWAVDGAQQAHLVKVDRREHRVTVVCGPGRSLAAADHSCQYRGREETYDVPKTNDDLAALMCNDTVNESSDARADLDDVPEDPIAEFVTPRSEGITRDDRSS